MNLNFMIELIVSLGTGMLLGAIFFGGLWMTVKKIDKVRQPWLLFLVSSLSRTLITLTGFWFVGIWLSEAGRWQRMTLCLIGFVIARHICTRLVGTENRSVHRESV
ncbi:MAG: ATP synthase subunit I [Planctomycetes bacterium]|nr:ATP synthase subunit I [Planctomycetota bacterium]MCH9779155.1 ATP synthase subunit I [Planctomycetota bacterium]MCH9792672.1 ATP synthase subunit I [Planctomycetota bacterium]MDF1746623.1 ATP synthase subunit I [Gimesia sp.]